MTEDPSGVPPESPPNRLDSWKDIAAYLKRDVSTVQRWEKREGMPVHRHLHDKLGSVYAFTAEIDAWWKSRQIRLRGAGEDAGENESVVPAAATASRARGHRVQWFFAVAAVAIAWALVWFLQRSDYFWRSPLSDARFTVLTDFEGTEQAAAISRDGRFVAFLADRDGPVDVFVTQAGSGQFHNLTGGKVRELVNRDVRTVGFSPDAALVSFWNRRRSDSQPADIAIWAVPTLGGEPRRYVDGAAECDWSSDGTRMVYHTPGPGDPMFVSDRNRQAERPVFTAPVGLHSHFPLWSRDDRYLYFVRGAVPAPMDIWRIDPSGGARERMTSHNSRVSYPAFIDRRTCSISQPMQMALDRGSTLSTSNAEKRGGSASASSATRRSRQARMAVAWSSRSRIRSARCGACRSPGEWPNRRQSLV